MAARALMYKVEGTFPYLPSTSLTEEQLRECMEALCIICGKSGPLSKADLYPREPQSGCGLEKEFTVLKQVKSLNGPALVWRHYPQSVIDHQIRLDNQSDEFEEYLQMDLRGRAARFQDNLRKSVNNGNKDQSIFWIRRIKSCLQKDQSKEP